MIPPHAWHDGASDWLRKTSLSSFARRLTGIAAAPRLLLPGASRPRRRPQRLRQRQNQWRAEDAEREGGGRSGTAALAAAAALATAC